MIIIIIIINKSGTPEEIWGRTGQLEAYPKKFETTNIFCTSEEHPKLKENLNIFCHNRTPKEIW